MAFSFTCYGADSAIESTDIYATYIDMSWNVPFGDTKFVDGFTYKLTFTANPASDCSFYRWVYRLGSTTATVQYSYSNPFVYTGDEDIYIRAEGTDDSGGGGGGSGDGDDTTVTKWDWLASNGLASANQTLRAYNQVNNNGYTTDFSHLVWNDMVDKVYAVIKATTNWWDGTYGSYYDTKMSGPREILTAKMFNSLRNNIELVRLYLGKSTTTGIGQVHTGDRVYGWYFTALTEFINGCIDDI